MYHNSQDQSPHSSTGGVYTVKTKKDNKWKYNAKDFGGNGLNRRFGSIQQQDNTSVPGCSPGG